jgi:hypothetical protein
MFHLASLRACLDLARGKGVTSLGAEPQRRDIKCLRQVLPYEQSTFATLARWT